MIGKYISHYNILEKIGTGGMGVVYKAQDTKLNRIVALKFLPPQLSMNQDEKKRFVQEAIAAASLDHSNICTVHEIGETKDEQMFIAMAYYAGQTLKDKITSSPLPIAEAIDIAIQIAEGLQDAHRNQIVHRDIKSANIIITKKKQAKILDFGLAKLRGVTRITKKGTTLGTVAYMSPEQASGEESNHRSDIWSLGVVLYEMITGQLPFKGEYEQAIMYSIMNEELEPVTGLRTGVPLDLEKIINKALEKDPSERYQHADDLIVDLKKAKKDSQPDITPAKRKSKPENVIKIPRRIMIIGGGLLLAAIIFVAIFIIFKGKTLSKPPIIKPGGIPSIIIPYLENRTDAKNADSEKFCIYLHEFVGSNSIIFKKKVDFLLRESLGQFKKFSILDLATLKAVGKVDKLDNSFPDLIKKFNIYYELKGDITKIGNIYNFDAVLISHKNNRKFSITVPGLESQDSILAHQIDTLTKRVYGKIYSKTGKIPEIKNIGDAYGRNWADFSNFYKGYNYFKRYETKNAEKYFLRSKELFASKYYLASLYYFNGDRTHAKTMLNEIVPDISKLTDTLGLKVLSLKARLDFNFDSEIKYLEKLKEKNELSKVAFYELGEAYFHHGNGEDASRYYRKAIDLDSNYSNAINHLGYCYSYLGDHERAIELFESYRNLDNSANSFDSLGDGYFFSGELLSAEASKRTAVIKDREGTYWAYITLADIYILKARFMDSFKSIESYLKLTNSLGDHGNAYAKKAFIEYSKDNLNEGLKFIEISLSKFDSKDINSNSSEAHWLKGIMLLSMDRKEESKKELKWLEDLVGNYNLSKKNYSIPLKFYLHLKAMVNEKEGEFEMADNSFKLLLGMKTQLSYWITIFNYQYFQTEYANFLLRNGAVEESLSEIGKCLEYSNKYIPALWVKAKIFEKGDKNSAEEIYKKLDNLYGEKREDNILTRKLKTKLNEFNTARN